MLEPRPRKLLDQVRDAIRVKHYSYSTEKTYVHWIRRFILFHNKRHPADMGTTEVTQFLTHLAVNEHVVATTQNQALNAIVFLYRVVLQRELVGAYAAYFALRLQKPFDDDLVDIRSVELSVSLRRPNDVKATLEVAG